MQVKVKLKNFCHKNASTCFVDRCCGVDWTECAVKHDLNYIRQKITRKEADKRLLSCVKERCKVVAYIMYTGVRLFGWYFWNKNKKDKK
jgi:23S rRNA U2552 (ribose-2'-O)-methylase RlmE/FtsJ